MTQTYETDKASASVPHNFAIIIKMAGLGVCTVCRQAVYLQNNICWSSQYCCNGDCPGSFSWYLGNRLQYSPYLLSFWLGIFMIILVNIVALHSDTFLS